jgi:hypothetical protein
MLRKKMNQYVEKLIAESKTSNGEGLAVEIYKEEKDYIERHQLLPENIKSSFSLIEQEPFSRFQHDVYIERGNKETEELLAEESSAFLNQPIDYFKQNIEEFMYLESPWFDLIGVDAISFEADSVFGNYDIMLGIKLPKKTEKLIKTFLTRSLQHEKAMFDLMFSANDGLWDLNFSLNDFSSFEENWSIREAYQAIYELLFKLVEEVEEGSRE